MPHVIDMNARFFFGFVLGIGCFVSPASGQDWLERRSKTYDLAVGGMHFRVPGMYMQPTTAPGSIDDHLGFSFWVSDGKAVWPGMHYVPEKDRVGRALFWPPEPGRSLFGVEDFLVQVVDARPMDERGGTERQRRTRRLATGNGGGVKTDEYGLECHTFPNSSKGCVTPHQDDLDVSMTSGVDPTNPVWRMYFYSRRDSIGAELRFPGLGLARWREAVCRTLSLIRSWRTPEDTAGPGCFEAQSALLN